MLRLLESLTFSDIPDELGSPDCRFAHNLYLRPPYLYECFCSTEFPKHGALFPSHPLAAQKIKQRFRLALLFTSSGFSEEIAVTREHGLIPAPISLWGRQREGKESSAGRATGYLSSFTQHSAHSRWSINICQLLVGSRQQRLLLGNHTQETFYTHFAHSS